MNFLFQSCRKPWTAFVTKVSLMHPGVSKRNRGKEMGNGCKGEIEDIGRGETSDWCRSVDVLIIVSRAVDVVASCRTAPTIWLKKVCYLVLNDEIEQCSFDAKRLKVRYCCSLVARGGKSSPIVRKSRRERGPNPEDNYWLLIAHTPARLNPFYVSPDIFWKSCKCPWWKCHDDR